jgi:hypothetical protein
MNVQKLKEAELRFLGMYPRGFDTPELAAMVKKHRLDKLTAFAREAFSPGVEDAEAAAENMVKLITRSSLVSVFEKPKFRDAVRAMSPDDKRALAGLLQELLHGNERAGFDGITGMLAACQIAKWPVVTAFRCYYHPETDLVLKPTTVKNVIAFFELEGLRYTPRPVFGFYNEYRSRINRMREAVSPLCGPSGAHFSGFLMMAMEM